MKIAKGIVTCILALATVAFAVWAGIWWAFIGGIVALIESVKASPTVPLDIALSIARILFTGLIFWGSFAIGMCITGIVNAIFPE